MTIEDNVKKLLADLPAQVDLVAVAKGRTPQEILQAVQAGIKIIGENYVQEAEKAHELIGARAQWHFIGRLQKNKVKKAVRLFDMIETVDSLAMATEIDMRCREIGKVMPVLVEINSAAEKQKGGVMPENAEELIRQIATLQNIAVAGLMTMGPRPGHHGDPRPSFAKTRGLFERLRDLRIPGVETEHLSMGTTDSYKVALQEGASILRIGTLIFAGSAPDEDRESGGTRKRP